MSGQTPTWKHGLPYGTLQTASIIVVLWLSIIGVILVGAILFVWILLGGYAS